MMKNRPAVTPTDVPGKKGNYSTVVWGMGVDFYYILELITEFSQGCMQPKERLMPSLQRSVRWDYPRCLPTPQPLLESGSRGGLGLVAETTPELLYPSHALLEERHVPALLVADIPHVGQASPETDRKLVNVRYWGKG